MPSSIFVWVGVAIGIVLLFVAGRRLFIGLKRWVIDVVFTIKWFLFGIIIGMFTMGVLEIKVIDLDKLFQIIGGV